MIRPYRFQPGLDLIPVILGSRFHSAARADHTGLASPPREFGTASAEDADQFVHFTLFSGDPRHDRSMLPASTFMGNTGKDRLDWP